MLKKQFVLSVLAFSLSAPLSVYAGPGHDHGDEAPVASTGDGPKRLATGEVFLPKPAQRQLDLRTQVVQVKPQAKVIEMNGQVALDPQSGGVVQTSLGGFFVPSSAGVPQLGEPVKKGQVLGFIQTPQAPLEKSAQLAQLSQLKSELALAKQRLERLTLLADTVPKKEIQATQAQVQSLGEQVSALSGGIGSREELRSLSNGVVASTAAIAGKVFSEGDVLFEIVNPKVVRIEATWFEPNAVPQFSSAQIPAGEKTLKLNYVGAASSVKNQSLSLVFEARDVESIRFPTGQLLKVYGELVDQIDGIAIPSAAVVKNAANQTIVWVKKEPELFEPKVVLTEPLNGVEVLVRSGLTGDERVVIQGSTLINQVR
ncbi:MULTISPECIES: efflux RND transporter periplasmic adaptor subunit [unclassified Limnobacter]|uniref:efflux RND transporter periplasmic adaptor subunit n=1 Tax=unclassified Limnobacter TaxID=2630203 RepID=UPI000C658772|nr:MULTISPECIES: efflux RND transporter periplasmic adaptor subunit [unclassified Limnobacter]MAG79717.1 hemolysin D [Sutterellaceae bacterium]MBT85613.1 hemolysin D [Sutterellaceae bacterium]HAV73608.1 hemolysin D [Limnobacter sp.]|tara:strand:+ start:24202 stop:25314 length:1113 start_codon:yes stop_codon:yes gene_type:complete